MLPSESTTEEGPNASFSKQGSQPSREADALSGDGDQAAYARSPATSSKGEAPVGSTGGGVRPAAAALSAGMADYQELAALAANDVVGQVPRYAAPSIASTLPAYRNGEHELIARAFHTGNYDLIRHLPDTIKEQQVHAARAARMTAVQTFLMPALTNQMRLKANAENQQGLFSTFEYIPSRYSLADELASKERVACESVRLTLGQGREFVPSVAGPMAKYEGRTPGEVYPHLGGPQEAAQEMELSQRGHHDGRFQNPPFVPSGTQKLAGEVPLRPNAMPMMQRLKQALLADWEGAELSMFENEHDCWVLTFAEASVDSAAGLAAYMNVFVRSNPLAVEYRLTKVVEYWGSAPGDGCVYYVLRPPWVAADKLEAFFTLHPEERDWRTSFPVVEMEKERQARQRALDAGRDELEVEEELMRKLSFKGGAPSNAASAQPTARSMARG